jgi:hypothetical protein
MEQFTIFIGVVALVSWTIGIGAVYACLSLFLLTAIQHASGRLQPASTSPTPTIACPTIA